MNYDPTAVIHTNPVHPGAAAPAPKGNRRALVVAAVVAAAIIAGGAGAALAWPSSPQADNAAASATAAPAEDGGELALEGDATVVSEAPAVADAPAAAAEPAKGAGPAGSGKSGGSGSANPGGGKAGPAPSIKSFSTPENIDCHNGNLQHFTAKWSTSNAVKVTISIDGSGIYDTYGPSGEASLPFNCSSPHTFLLKAYGSDGKSVSKTVTLKPRNVQPAEPEAPADEN